MLDRLLALVALVITAAPAAAVPQTRVPLRPARCTPRSLAAVREMPELEYDCVEGGNDDENRGTPERDQALATYRSELETYFAAPTWWATPVEQLNACSIVGEARALTAEERANRYRSDGRYDVFGDDSTRLVLVPDPCLLYSVGSLDGFILQRVDGRVYATQVLDGYTSRIDDGISMWIARLGRERLIVVGTAFSDGFMPPDVRVTWTVYAIDPKTHRAVPRTIFKEEGKLTNTFEFAAPPFESDRLSNRWRAPELVRRGRLAPRLVVWTPIRGRLLSDTYVWNGRYYSLTR